MNFSTLGDVNSSGDANSPFFLKKRSFPVLTSVLAAIIALTEPISAKDGGVDHSQSGLNTNNPAINSILDSVSLRSCMEESNDRLNKFLTLSAQREELEKVIQIKFPGRKVSVGEVRLLKINEKKIVGHGKIAYATMDVEIDGYKHTQYFYTIFDGGELEEIQKYSAAIEKYRTHIKFKIIIDVLDSIKKLRADPGFTRFPDDGKERDIIFGHILTPVIQPAINDFDKIGLAPVLTEEGKTTMIIESNEGKTMYRVTVFVIDILNNELKKFTFVVRDPFKEEGKEEEKEEKEKK